MQNKTTKELKKIMKQNAFAKYKEQPYYTYMYWRAWNVLNERYNAGEFNND